MPPEPETGASNRFLGWLSLALGVGTGLVLGAWSFDGPLAVPSWLGDYADTPRRLARLGHVAFVGLGIVNLLLARELGRSSLGERGARATSLLMNLGNALLPVTLFAAACWQPFKYLLPGPAACVFAALLLAAWGARRPRGGSS